MTIDVGDKVQALPLPASGGGDVSLASFKGKYDLPFAPLADIDGKGAVRRVWRKAKVAGHVDEVTAAAQAL